VTQDQDIEALLLLIEKLQEREIADLIEQPIAIADARLSRQAHKALSKVLKFYFHQLQDILQEKPSACLNLNMSHRNDPIATAIAELADLVHIARKSAQDLTSAFEQERQKLLEQDWIKSHYTTIFDKLKGSKTLVNLGEIFVVELAQATNAQVAVLLIASSAVESSSNKSTDSLKIVATYGRRIDSARPPIPMGEGILGQCCLDRRIKYIDDTPADYVLLDSALGQTRIKSIVFLHCCLANLRIMSAGYRNHFDNFSVNSSQTLYLKGFSRKS
jgi:hypothetical protein